MLYIIRHGKTDWNAVFKLQGSTDIPLNEEGREMAIAARESIKDIKLDICYCSPLIRARETAELMLANRPIDIFPDSRLREMSFGEYEGYEKVVENTPHLPIAKFFLKPEDYVADRGAESLDELFKRTGDFLDTVLRPELAKGRNILVVGHGAMNCSLICQIKGYGYKDFWKEMTGNCQLMKFDL